MFGMKPNWYTDFKARLDLHIESIQQIYGMLKKLGDDTLQHRLLAINERDILQSHIDQSLAETSTTNARLAMLNERVKTLEEANSPKTKQETLEKKDELIQYWKGARDSWVREYKIMKNERDLWKSKYEGVVNPPI